MSADRTVAFCIKALQSSGQECPKPTIIRVEDRCKILSNCKNFLFIR